LNYHHIFSVLRRELEHLLSREDFWDDADKATALLKERTLLSNLLETWENIYKDIEEADILLELSLEESDKESELEVLRLVGASNGYIQTPLLINYKEMTGRQVILTDSGFSVRQSLV